MFLSVSLKASDSDHGCHHADQTNRQPSSSIQAVEIKDWDPRRQEEYNANASGAQIACLGI
jgi:hypothetical protein